MRFLARRKPTPRHPPGRTSASSSRRRSRVSSELTQAMERAQECVLGHIVGIRQANDPGRHAVHDGLVALHKRLERGEIARQCPLYELFVGGYGQGANTSDAGVGFERSRAHRRRTGPASRRLRGPAVTFAAPGLSCGFKARVPDNARGSKACS